MTRRRAFCLMFTLWLMNTNLEGRTKGSTSYKHFKKPVLIKTKFKSKTNSKRW